MEWKMALWFVGMWIVSGFVYTIFGMQIGISKNCALKLQAMMTADSKLWYPDACLLYFRKIIRRNRMIVAILFALVLFFIPVIGFIGFAAGYFWKMLRFSGQTRFNENNLSECVEIFMQFAKPGMEEQLRAALRQAIHSMTGNTIYKNL